MQKAQTAKPTKQRKMLFQAPDHTRYKQFTALLSPELRKSYHTRNIPLRSGDTVRIMRGDYKGFEGKVTRVDRKKYRIYVEGLTREKVDGTTIFVPVHPSKVMITKLNLDDKWRKKILERKKKAEEAVEKPTEEKIAIKEPTPKKKRKPKRKSKKEVKEKPKKKRKKLKTTEETKRG